MFLFRKKTELPKPGDALPGRPDPIPDGSQTFRVRPPACRALSGRAEDSRRSVWAAFGARNASSGSCATASGSRRLAMPAARRPTRPTKKSAPASPATTRSCASSSTRQRSLTPSLLKVFWENHDPTQGMQQGNDVGTQYRSGIYCETGDDLRDARELRSALYANALAARRMGAITTEIVDAPAFYFAEDYHQQYLAKNPAGYCGLGGTGVSCPIGTGVAA